MKRLLKMEKGQSLLLFTFFFPIIIGLAGLLVDLGWVVYNQSKIQNSADVSALSGAQHLPSYPVKAKSTAMEIFKDNYGYNTAISNINTFNQDKGIKVHYEEKLPLFFLPILGINDVTIEGKAEAITEPLAKPVEIIPVGIWNTTTLKYGEITTIFGNVDNSLTGNFGLIDPTNDSSMQNTDLENWIANNYKGQKGMPNAGDLLTTKTGLVAGPVNKGFNARIDSGNPYVVCPILDVSKTPNGKSQLPLVGFARFELISSVITGVGASTRVEVKGRFLEYIDPKIVTDQKAEYWGIKSVYLIK